MRLLKWFLFMFCFTFAAQVYAQTAVLGKVEPTTPEFDNVYKSLLEKPGWLFAEDSCPFDIFPKSLDEKIYEFEACAKYADVCLDKCKNNDGAACYSLAVSIQDKKGPQQDISEGLFLRACKLGIISGCTNRAARILNDKPEGEKSLKCAADTFEKTCEKDDPWGCTMFGFVLYTGISRPKDNEKALQALSKSCKYGEEDEACSRAKELIEKIKKSKTEKPKK
jgi:TPR repeat protein